MSEESEIRKNQVKWLRDRIYIIKVSAYIINREKPEHSNFLSSEAEMLQSILNYIIKTSGKQ